MRKSLNLSIYFIHFFSAFLPFVFIAAFASAPIKRVSQIGVAIFVAFLFAYFAFFIAANSLHTAQLHFFVNFIIIFCFLVLFVLSFFKGEFAFLRLAFIAFLSFGVGVRYFVISQDFAVFTSSLLDNQAVISLGFIILALLLLVLLFVFLRWNFALNKKLSLIFLALILLCEVDKISANILLTAMRENLIATSETALSFVAKSLDYADKTGYIYLLFALILSFACLKFRAKNNQKRHLFDIKFRQNEAKRATINAYFSSAFISLVVAFCVMAHFDLVSSKPLQIDESKEVLPDSNGLFVFDAKLLRDNALHRFAYVTSEGKVVRFFLLNKREDRDSPVAVFDACMLCGDMGYIKRGGELICIACNVRIFLLSVGKEGGCNPIPLPYEFNGEQIIIKLEDVIIGTNYFTQIKEILVQDPVSKTKILNSKAEFSYMFKGITYYFASEANYNAFVSEPEKYVDNNVSAKFRAQGYEKEM